jgi:hypothetical protein
MRTRFAFDIKGVYTLIGVFSVGFILMFMPLITSGLFVKLAIGSLVVAAFLGILGVGLARGTYVLLDRDKDLFRTSGFFMSKSVPLSGIVRLTAHETFAGLMTEVHVTYRRGDSGLKTMNMMNRQSFKGGDFAKFLEALQSANPRIEISRELLK